MGFDYALVHLKYTIPPAAALTLLCRPLFTKLDVYKILFLVTIAVISTTPWDSYLIRSRIWTYPSNAIVGPTLFSIPAEEVFFFFIQTYITSLLYILLSKPTFHPIYLRGTKLLYDGKRVRLWQYLGVFAIVASILMGACMVARGGKGLYMGLIIVWAGPFILLLWSVAYQFILGLPKSNTLMPIITPTLYLWVVDTLALRRGTWTIESGTKLEWHLWEGLDVEEAVFFLLTNVLIVFGLVAFDNAFAILQSFPGLFTTLPTMPSPLLLIRALLVSPQAYDEHRILGLKEALDRLRAKSRSFYLASGVFQGRLRVDLVILYSFCRVADDLVDEANTPEEARDAIKRLRQFLDLRYGTAAHEKIALPQYIDSNFPASARATLHLLPTHCISAGPLYDLLNGFVTDLDFSSEAANPFPIRSSADLETYGAQVAGTVAESCLELVYHHSANGQLAPRREQNIKAGQQMGIALQYINIARDIGVDAINGRVYLPTQWLKEVELHPQDVINFPASPKVERLRQRLLDQAMAIYEEAKGAIEDLPQAVRAPMRVAVESYVEIGRVLRTPDYRVKAGRATVPKGRRLRVAWNALGG